VCKDLFSVRDSPSENGLRTDEAQLADGALARQITNRMRVVSPKKWQGRGTVALARALLGKVLVRTTPTGRQERVIVETEAYVGPQDLACHASKGCTPRTQVMFGDGGVWYVYLCYGIHEMLNLVTGPAGHPAAILIRGVEGAIGPGRVTKQLAIDRALNGKPAAPESGLHLEDHGIVAPPRHVISGPRVGVDYAGPIWAAKPWRFCIAPENLRRPID
jgi:DNA-3-methyladenine glycosylase